MKKYITLATLLAAGSAFANAGAIYSSPKSDLQEGLAYYWNFDHSSQEAGNSTAANTTPTTYVYENDTSNWQSSYVAHTYHVTGGVGDSGYFSYDNNWGDTYAENLNLDAANFSVSLFVKGARGGENHLFSAGGDTQFLLKLYGGTGSPYLDAPVVGTGTLPNGIDFTGDDWTRITLTCAEGMISMYVNAQKIYEANAQDKVSGTIKSIQIGAFIGTNYKSTCSLDDVAVWNRALSQEEVDFLASNAASSTFNVPEPSTFGLLAGLGALALVGTRRRRK